MSSLPVTLVLLPGLDGTDVFFRPLRSALPSWIRTIVVEYPPDGPNDYDDLAGKVEDAVSGLDEFFVLGWSFGGPLALRLAAARPDAVRGVVLCASFVLPPRPELVPWKFAVVGPVIGAVRALRRTRLLLPRLATTELRHAKAETWRRVGSRVLAARSRAALSVDARSDLAACGAPVLYLAFSGDRTVPMRNGLEVLDGARRAEMATLPGAHLGLFTSAREAQGPIVAFLRR